MELEFDKEIDAILRKNARGSGAGSMTSAHLEADEIAAFAENASPPGARLLYIKHLADCDRCRRILSQTIALYPEAEAQAASYAVSTGAVEDIRLPWYRKLFAIPNLAASMGALALVFAGLLGYLVYERSLGGRNADVAQLNKSETANANRTLSEPAVSSSSNAAANAVDTSENTASPTITSGGSPIPKALGQEEPNQPVIGEIQPGDTEKDERLRGAEEVPAPPATAPVLKEEAPKVEADDKKLAEKKPETKQDSKTVVTADAVTENRAALSKDAPLQNNQQIQSNAAGGPLKAKKGPYRDMQQRNTVPNAAAREDETLDGRRVAGKSFEKKDGVWYDSAYHGQSTTNIRRGSAEYRALDSGLRNIVESMSGTVVVVWKDKAYRIQ